MKNEEKREEFVSTRSRIEKLGVKPGADVVVLGVEDDAVFMKELHDAGASVRKRSKPCLWACSLQNRNQNYALTSLLPLQKRAAKSW